MHKPASTTALLIAACIGPAAAEPAPPLTAAQLQACAERAQQLRSEAARLNAQASDNDATRAMLADLREKGRNSSEALIRYNRNAEDFNAAMADFRADVREVNKVKNAYDAECAGRSYRRSDFAALDADKQAAMRDGLGDVRVPVLSDD